MTANQLRYWENVERERSNRANEALTDKKLGIEDRRVKTEEQQVASKNFGNIGKGLGGMLSGLTAFGKSLF